MVGLAVLSESDHSQLILIIAECGQQTESWYGVLNSTIRAAPDSKRWSMVDQVCGGFLDHTREALAKVSNLQALQMCRAN